MKIEEPIFRSDYSNKRTFEGTFVDVTKKKTRFAKPLNFAVRLGLQTLDFLNGRFFSVLTKIGVLAGSLLGAAGIFSGIISHCLTPLAGAVLGSFFLILNISVLKKPKEKQPSATQFSDFRN